MVYEKKKISEVATLLGGMPPDEAIDFIVEVTTNWCFSIPMNFLPLIPNDLRADTDEAIAYAIYEWLVGYIDLWH